MRVKDFDPVAFAGRHELAYLEMLDCRERNAPRTRHESHSYPEPESPVRSPEADRESWDDLP